MAIRPYRSQNSVGPSHNFKGFHFKLTIIKIFTTNLRIAIYADCRFAIKSSNEKVQIAYRDFFYYLYLDIIFHGIEVFSTSFLI